MTKDKPADKLDEHAIAARKQRVEQLRTAAAAWEGKDKDYAARLTAEADATAADPDFADMQKVHERHTNMTQRITAESEKAGADALLAERAAEKAIKETGSAGGTKSGEVRKVRPWHERALELAIKSRAENGELSQADLADKIRTKWQRPPPKPSQGCLINFIRARENDGRLARRKT